MPVILILEKRGECYMKKYGSYRGEDIELDKIVRGDCIEVLRSMPNGCY